MADLVWSQICYWLKLLMSYAVDNASQVFQMARNDQVFKGVAPRFLKWWKKRKKCHMNG
ncbi:hypothetical protein HanXRQr2_Chr15g0713501 [Helianthus annuus]|uniref:Uncharacterized protein n=1 Tax=Helianthus annuus TaxID=4232 RepID=A0A9K3E3Q7_HELAN|nr:hypothetical protein HanXRQr2_Chr15g0713501 [Helianthus annuus]KAJ0832959.1 hypothetical protein HanPSC8_Chr15g0684711 [Helianthus annuus]